MAKSSAELANWRDRPEYQFQHAAIQVPDGRGNPTQSLFDFIRNSSWAGLGTVNRMPHVFDPAAHNMNFIGTDPATIANSVKPGSATPNPAYAGPSQTSLPADQQGILQMLINQQSPALMALLGGGDKSGQ
jgi:hypothetical protein